MLQFSQAPPDVDFLRPDPPQRAGAGLVDWALGFLFRRYLVIALLLLLGGMGGGIFLSVKPPTYTAEAKILIGAPKPEFIQQQSLLTDTPLDQTQMETQFQLLRSKAILAPIVLKLKLADDPEFSSPSGGLIERVVHFFRNSSSPQPKLDPTENAISALADRLSINRVGWSRVIEIGARSRSPEKAAQIANAVATAYIDDQQEAKLQANRTASTWLQERLRQLQEQAAAAERAKVEFKQQNNILSADGKRLDEVNVANVNERLLAARNYSSEVLARLTRLESTIRTWNPTTSSIADLVTYTKQESGKPSMDGTTSDELGSPILTSLRQQYLDLSRREADWSTKYGREHGAVVDLRKRLVGLRASALEELQRIAAVLKNDYAIAQQQQVELEKQLGRVISEAKTVNNAAVSLQELESNASTYRSMYESFLQRYTGAVQQDSYPLVETRLISSASALSTKVKPRPLLVFGFSLMGGLALGVGAGLLRDLMDRVFRTRTQVQSQLQIPCISLVPFVKRSDLSREKLVEKASGERTVRRDASMFWRVVESPSATFAEAIRSIKLAIHYKGKGSNRVIGFTSALPNEGKSTIAAAVAQLTAKVGGRAIIIDCDLRIPSLSRRWAPNASLGITDVISGARSLEETVWKDPTTNLFFLPAVQTAPLFASEVLESESLKKLIDRLRESFDIVIVDLPPLVPIVDARAAIHLVDCMILVIEWGRTEIDVVRHALNTTPDLHQVIIGAALNKTKMDHLCKYDVQHKSMYKDKYHARYAYLEGNRESYGKFVQNAGTALSSPIEIADGVFRSRRSDGSNCAELELCSPNQVSGKSRAKTPSTEEDRLAD
jgi:succinoglycan biosynthesis transport protein ExoP